MITQKLLDKLKVGQKVKINHSGIWLDVLVKSISANRIEFLEDSKNQYFGSVSAMLAGSSFIKEIVIDDFYVGQKLTVAFNSNKILVVEVTDNLVFIRDPDSEDARIFTYEKTWLKSRVIEFAEPVVTELTLQEIADKFNIPVKDLRVKDA